MPIDPTQKKSGFVNAGNAGARSSSRPAGKSFGDVLARTASTRSSTKAASHVKGAQVTDDDDSQEDDVDAVVKAGAQSATAGMSGPAQVDSDDEPSLDEVEVENP